MIVNHSSHEFSEKSSRAVVALGNYDGVHLGHQKLIRTARDEADRLGGILVIYTFDPHPVRVLAPKSCPPQLQTLELRLETLKFYGADLVIVEPFTHELAQMTPEEFFTKIIVERMGAKSIVVGYDFTFGLHRQGTVKTLEHLCKNRGIGLVVVEPQFLDDTLISSTNIRKFVAAGDVGAAAKLLGRPYLIRGTIISGRGIGGKLHAHTANIETKNEIIPQNGVYITRTNIWENKEADPPNFASYDSITSIGDNPTFPEAGFSIETHLIAANVDVLEMTADILFIKHMRAQLAFDSTKLLAKQIQKDIDAARRYHLLHKDC